MYQLVEHIMREQSTFPAAQRLVAAYVIDNSYQIPFLSISTLAKNVGVSDSTVIKFCSRLGFDSYSEFKSAFSDFVQSELVMYNKLSTQPADKTANDIFSLIQSEDTQNIRVTLSDPINQKNLPALKDMICAADHIYILGGRTSACLADYFGNTLRYLGLPVHTLSGGISDLLDRVSTISKKDLVITICFPRYTSSVIQIMNVLHEQQIPIALLTGTSASPAYPYADLVFHCALDASGYTASYVSCMSLIRVICYNVAAACKDTAIPHIHKLEQQLLEHGIFV